MKKIAENSNNEYFYIQLQAMVLSVIIGLSVASYFFIFRYGFDDNSITDLLKGLSLNFCIIIIPNILFYYKNINNKLDTIKWNNSIALYFILNLLFFGGLGLLSNLSNINLLNFVFFLGIVSFLWFIYILFKIKIAIKFWIVFILFGIFIPFFFYKTIIHDPLFLEKIILGTAHVDLIYLLVRFLSRSID